MALEVFMELRVWGYKINELSGAVVVAVDTILTIVIVVGVIDEALPTTEFH